MLAVRRYKDTLLRPCDRFQGRPMHPAVPCIHPQPIEHVQASPLASSCRQAILPRCRSLFDRQCLRLFPSSQHRRFLFSAYAPLPVLEALLPITHLALGCPYDLPWLRNARIEPDAAGKAQKTFASQNSSPCGFLVPPCPWSEPVRLPDHKEGHKGPHQVPRRSS